jgi:hypothetical protein
MKAKLHGKSSCTTNAFSHVRRYYRRSDKQRMAEAYQLGESPSILSCLIEIWNNGPEMLNSP